MFLPPPPISNSTAHTSPPLSQPINGALPVPKEESKLSEQTSHQQSDSKDPALTFQPTQFYKLVHTTSEWQMVSDTLTPLSQAKLNLQEIIAIIEKFIKTFDSNPQVNAQLLSKFIESLIPSEKSEWEKKIFPGLAQLILRTPELFPDKVPILVQDKPGRVSLTKEQCTCLLAHMFMCTTVDPQNKLLPKSYNFSEIISEGQCKRHLKLEKLKCLYNYFRRALVEKCKIPIIFERLVQNENIHGKCSLEFWKQLTEPLGKLELRTKGKISEAEDAMEIGFANRFYGGSALRNGSAQEQIMMITTPELLVGILITERMNDMEAILIRGTETYSSYTGHLDSFAFAGDFKDNRPMTPEGIMDRDIIAIDALSFKVAHVPNQYSKEAIIREINKAYVGFCGNYNSKEHFVWKGISTGKWGCGAFLGNAQVKLIVQWIAASRSGRELWFYTFGNEKDIKGIEKVQELYKNEKIGKLVEDVVKCCEVLEKSKKKDKDLFEALIAIKSK